MKKKILPITLSAVMVAGTMGLTGCFGGSDGKDTGSETSAETSAEAVSESSGSQGGNLKSSGEVTAYVGTSIFDNSMDPVKGFMCYAYPFVGNALLKMGTDYTYKGDLADSWEISDDALTYTFKLKDGVKFSDGSDFTAEDVVFTYETVMENQANNENVDLTCLDSVKAVDDRTVEFKLKKPYSPFFDTVAMLQIVPSDAYDSETFDTHPIGTGAYKVSEYTTNQQIILEANEDCFSGAPGIEKVTLVYMDHDAAIAAANSGQLDIVMVGAGYAKEEIPGMNMQRFETMDVRHVSLPVLEEQEMTDADGNTRKVGNNITSDAAVRKALSIGINRQNIIDNSLNGIGKPAESFVNLAWSIDLDYEDGRTDEAKKILEDAGWKDEDGDGILEKNGNKCEFDMIAPGNDSERYNISVALAEEAEKLGIRINVQNLSWNEADSLTNSTPIIWGWGQYNPVLIDQLLGSEKFLTGAYNDVTGYKNDEVDEDIRKALESTSQDEASENWKAAQKKAEEDYPYLYIANIEHCFFINDNLDISPDTQIKHSHGHGAPIVCNMAEWSWK